MIDEKKLIEELEAWKARCGAEPVEEVAKVMVKAFIDRVKAQPLIDTETQIGSGWMEHMMQRFSKGE